MTKLYTKESVEKAIMIVTEDTIEPFEDVLDRAFAALEFEDEKVVASYEKATTIH